MANKITYQGEPGANSHIVCKKNYPKYTHIPCETFESAFQLVEDDRADLAMIPIENTLAGRVADIHHLLPEAELSIIGECFLAVHHHLLGVAKAEIDDLKKVQSHIHALGQCRKIIHDMGLKVIIGADTAGSAREIAERDDKHCAAIATGLAAKIYGLKILKKNIQDTDYNVTRFVVLSKAPRLAPYAKSGIITAFIFVVRNIPSALFKSLGGFATNGVNMTKLESYHLGKRFHATQFYAEIMGHPDDPAVQRSFEELTFFCRSHRVLGVFRASRYRRTVTRAISSGEQIG